MIKTLNKKCKTFIFLKNIQNGAHIVRKNTSNLVVKTVCQMDVRVRSYRGKMKLNCLACMHTSRQLFHLHGLGGCACKPPDITSHLLQTARLAACVRFLVIAASGSGERALNKNLGSRAFSSSHGMDKKPSRSARTKLGGADRKLPVVRAPGFFLFSVLQKKYLSL